MSSLVIYGDTSGAITLTPTAIAGTNTQTLPAATGTVMVSGNMPAFSATNNTTQSISSGVWTKISFQTEEFDTASCFDNTTNYRFTPNVAGYYQVNLGYAESGYNALQISIYKNGSAYKSGAQLQSGGAISVSALVYLNGSTDYIEGYANVNANTSIQVATNTFFQAVMVRGA